ncbi:PREDICTED: embryogenesis-associated [Prunus dulcis]|uniref:PREDICTED: embryogenesis-associated n=1 Tax=Prunus dulcis TaxID=3755 RepID=A0A5E4GEM2_PRUDU|nr:embryogenesis-associated protein EMB8 isoform X1 [Prunus dulcis]VVA38206.1 PREDICTED: embryogenesis-associated [Prunus dulcis]
MDCRVLGEVSENPYVLLLNDLSLIPISHYFFAFLAFSFAFLYHFLEFHFLQDLFNGFRGSPIGLTYNPSSPIYHGVVSKCRILHARYLATPWLSSPHFQTVFLSFFGRPPAFSYRRKLFNLSDGGTVALDWLLSSDVSGDVFSTNNAIPKGDTTPIVLVIPGLTSDSDAAYIKHLAFNTAKKGWNVVVSNHRGLGGISVTSDFFYNAGWTEDLRTVVSNLHDEYPNAPLFLVGLSVGANILVKYLGEDGDKVPVAGAVAICSPWDLLIGDRFIGRRLLQKFYDKALTTGLLGYAQLHQPRFFRLANWEGIKKSRSIRDFDQHATCIVGKFETVDTYYRRCTSANYVGNVSVPLLCISALDDPVCTREAIPWEECRANINIVLATTKHGGHLAFFEGLTAAGIWWVRATDEFLKILHSSQYMHVQKMVSFGAQSSLDSSIDQGPYVNIAEDGMVAAVGNEQAKENRTEDVLEQQKTHQRKTNEMVSGEQDDHMIKPEPCSGEIVQSSEQATTRQDSKPLDVISPVRRCLELLSQRSRWSFWLLVYVAIVTSWPLVGSALQIVFRKKLRNISRAA